MTTDRSAVRRFFRTYSAAPVGPTPVQPTVPPDDGDGDEKPAVDLSVELPADEWNGLVVPETPARDGEFPRRFIDGSQAGQPVLCVRSPQGWPIPLVLSEVGAVELKLVGRGFERGFVAVERVLSFVADPFPWEEVEGFADELLNLPELKLRVLPANRPAEPHSPFDYEVMRTQARARAQQEMTTLERLALAVDLNTPTLVDGPLNRVMGNPKPNAPLLVGVAKSQAADYLHPRGWRTLLDLKPGQRTPVFRYEGFRGGGGNFPVASWYVKLAGGPRLAPNWGYVRVEVPWGQFAVQFGGDFGFVHRLSRWLIDARCRTDSYARMPVSLDPIVRAEDALHPHAGAGQPSVPHRRPVPRERTVTDAHTSSCVVLGRVAAPPEHESTSGVFYFWVDKKQGVERTLIVTTRSTVGDREVQFIGIVQEVYRRSRQKDVTEEAARFDGRSGERPMFDSEGVTYAEVAILRTTPVAHTPPIEESEVFLATPQEAAEGYGVDRMKQRLDVGLLRSGGTQFAGRAAVDLAFLLGENGGHLNVNGIAGLGTKSTLLLSMNWLLLREAKRQKTERPSDPKRLQVVPVIFNVKNFDLFFIDRWNTEFKRKEDENRKDWREMGVNDPTPFDKPQFFTPQAKGLQTPVGTGGRTADVKAYSWSLSDIVEQHLFTFLFSEDDVNDANFGGIVGEMEEWLTHETDAGLKLRKDRPQTFEELLTEFRDNRDSLFTDYVKGTKGKLLRRLKYVVQEGDGVLRRNDPKGNPLRIPTAGVESPVVIDLYGIHGTPSLQRFVVAAVFHQIQQTQSAKQVPNLKYLITLDELNRFAPKDSHDPIT